MKKILFRLHFMNLVGRFFLLALMFASPIYGSATSYNINKKDEYGYTALMRAAQKNDPEEVEKLIKAGADIDYQNPLDKFGNTALLLAVQYTKPEVVEKLLLYGADPNKQDERGNTALLLAAQDQNPELVEMLLLYGADPNKQDKQGNTALLNAKDDFLELSSEKEQDETINMLKMAKKFYKENPKKLNLISISRSSLTKNPVAGLAEYLKNNNNQSSSSSSSSSSSK